MSDQTFNFETVACEDWAPRIRYRFMISSILPRPIGWISTRSADGVNNLAPFSWFNSICADPVMVMIAIGRRAGEQKDTARNIRETGEFVFNLASEPLLQRMVQTSADHPPEVSELEHVGLTPLPSVDVAPPRVAESPIHIECVLDRIIELGDVSTDLVLGRGVRFHFAEGVCHDGICDINKLQPVGRLGGIQYAIIDHVVEMPPVKPD